MIFSKRLKDIRKQRELSQKEYASLLGISSVTLSHYENGKREPDLDRLVSICTCLNVSSDYMLGLTNSLTKPKEVPITISNTSVPRHASNPLDDLDPDLRSKAEGYIDNLLEQQKERKKQTQTQEA